MWITVLPSPVLMVVPARHTRLDLRVTAHLALLELHVKMI